MSDDFAKGFITILGNFDFEKERKRPKSFKVIFKKLADDISSYASEVLDPLFVDKGKYKETIYDWEYEIQNNLDQFKEEIFKKSWVYDLEDNNTCHGNEDNCPITEEMNKNEQKKLCKNCFEEIKEDWCNSYKRGIDIAIEYFKTYFKTSNIRKEYLTIITPNQKNQTDNNTINDLEVDLDLLIKSIPKPKRISKQTILKEYK